jgi:putative acetyltransferase
MKFTPVSNQHAQAVRNLVFGVLREYRLEPDPASTDRDLLDIQAGYADSGGCFELVIEEPEVLVGCYGLYPLGDGVCELRKMYLRREYRGRGLGKLILRRALEQARALGFQRVQLETSSVLSEAVALYASFGFRPFKPDHMSARCDVAMRLDLNAQ